MQHTYICQILLTLKSEMKWSNAETMNKMDECVWIMMVDVNKMVVQPSVKRTLRCFNMKFGVRNPRNSICKSSFLPPPPTPTTHPKKNQRISKTHLTKLSTWWVIGARRVVS